ncbi:MAG TPA: hypothetical protein VFU12_12100 [Glycomyces sp.]|nr:hypothetical protein [Glycomyces sp.]
MIVLLSVVGSLAGLCYFAAVVIVRALSAETEAAARAVRTYLARRDAAGARLGIGEEPSQGLGGEALRAEAEQWPGWEAEYRRQMAATLQPGRGVLWAAVLIATVLAAIAVNLRFGGGNSADGSLAATWPVLLFFVAPWFTATGAVDLADRLRRLARRGDR